MYFIIFIEEGDLGWAPKTYYLTKCLDFFHGLKIAKIVFYPLVQEGLD